MGRAPGNAATVSIMFVRAGVRFVESGGAPRRPQPRPGPCATAHRPGLAHRPRDAGARPDPHPIGPASSNPVSPRGRPPPRDVTTLTAADRLAVTDMPLLSAGPSSETAASTSHLRPGVPWAAVPTFPRGGPGPPRSRRVLDRLLRPWPPSVWSRSPSSRSAPSSSWLLLCWPSGGPAPPRPRCLGSERSVPRSLGRYTRCRRRSCRLDNEVALLVRETLVAAVLMKVEIAARCAKALRTAAMIVSRGRSTRALSR